MTKIRTHMVQAMDLGPSIERMRCQKPKATPAAHWRNKRQQVAKRNKRNSS